MGNSYIDGTKYLVGGSNPHIFPWISSEETTNFLVLPDCLAPSHGKKPDPVILNGQIRAMYRSISSGNVYIASGSKISRFTSDSQLTSIGDISANNSHVIFLENQNNELLIIDGINAYVHNMVSGAFITLTNEDHNFQIENPNSAYVINNIAFVGSGALLGTIQPSVFNNFLEYQQNQDLVFEGEPDVIVGMGTIRNNAFVIGKNHVERFTVTPNGPALMAPDQLWNAAYGLVSVKSLSNRFNMIVGLFSNKQGSTQVRMLDEALGDLKTLSTPGIMIDIGKQGEVVNSDIYEVDGIIYYELSFDDKSYIYNFTNQSWTYSTSPFDRVVFLDGIHFGARGYQLFEFNYYNNDQLKTRTIRPLTYRNERFSIGESEIFIYNNPLYNTDGSEKRVMVYWSDNNIIYTYQKEVSLNSTNYYEPLPFYPQLDGYQFSMKIQTQENIQLSSLRLKILAQGR